MERNPSFTKEKADFVFNKIKSYYDQNAYRLVISEYENNKELIGSVLNIGSQLKLNKYISTSILNLLIDAFEVDGNLSLFDDLWNKYHTNLEIHNSKENYQLVYKYHTEREKNTNFKSKTEHLNNDIPADESSFDDVIQLSIKASNKKTKSTEEIEQDFLNSIEKPTYMFSLIDDDIEQSYEKITKSDVDDDAIKEDFFSSIKPPSINKSQNIEDFEQLSFNDTTNYETLKNTKEQKNKPKKKRNSNAENQTSIDLNTTDTLESDYKNKLVPISIDNTILAKKENDAIKRLKTKINSIENKSSKEDEPTKETLPDDSSVLAQRTFVKDGKKGTHTVYKSGARVTEITIETGISSADENQKQNTRSKKNVETNQKNSRSKNNKSKIASKQSSNQNKTNGKIQTSASSNKNNSANKKNKEAKKTKKQNKSSFKYILLTLLLVIMAVGGYYHRDNVFATLSKFSTSLNSAMNKQERNNNQNNSENNSSGTDENQPSTSTPEEDPLDTPSIEPEEPEVNYILPSHEREITAADMANMSKSEVRYALNEMFARYGWHFGQSGDFYNYFMEQSWYKPDLTLKTPLEAEKKMSELEIKNLVTIKARYDSMR